MTQKEQLKDRVEQKKHELQARLAELKAQGRAKADEECSSIENKLEELKEYLAEGWQNLSEKVAGKLNKWLQN